MYRNALILLSNKPNKILARKIKSVDVHILYRAMSVDTANQTKSLTGNTKNRSNKPKSLKKYIYIGESIS